MRCRVRDEDGSGRLVVSEDVDIMYVCLGLCTSLLCIEYAIV